MTPTQQLVFASGGKTAPAFLGFFEYMHFRNLRHTLMLRHFLGWVGWGGGCWRSWELATHAHATSLLGLGGVGCGMLTFVRTCDTRACYVTSWVAWGGVGNVDVRENLRHTRMLPILASEALTCVKQSPTNPALLLTDGAPCYRSLSAEFGWRHEACNHSKGIFCIKKRIENKTVLIHTGGVDSMWRLSKSAIPSSLATRVNGHVNPKLMRSIRIWQWRWMNSK